MRYLDAAGVRQLKELNDAAYVGKEEYNDDTMVISAALNDLNGRVTTAESEIAGFSEGDENIIETVKVNGTALTVTDKAVDVTVPTTLASLTDDSTHRLVTDTEKTKLQGIAAGAEVNVQSDWSVTDSTSDAYIVNKPTIPTKVSDLTNDSGFTTNTGTITGVTMNGVSKGTSGVVDLGTVITDVSGKADASAAIGTLSLAIDNTNYQITLSGTKVDGTTFTVSNVIDLPLESVVVNGSYNNTTKKVVLTLQNGSTVDFSVADLVSGLQSEITSTNKLSADLISDGTTNKVVTATEKSTWNAKADTASPTFTGTPTAPTATAGTNNTQIATTAFVNNAITNSSNKGSLEPSIFGTFSFSGSTLADVPPGSAIVNATDKSGNNILSSNIGDYYDSSSSKYPIIEIEVTVEGTSSSDPGYTSTMLFTEFSNTVSGGLWSGGGILQSSEVIADDSSGQYYFYVILDYTNDTNIKIYLYKRSANADWNATYGPSKILNKPTIPTKVSDLTNDSGFTSNAGTITGITMNNVSKGTSGVVDLGTVLTSHQDISGKEDTSNKVTSLSSSSTDTQYPSAKTVYDFVSDSIDSAQRVFSETPSSPKEGDIVYVAGSSTTMPLSEVVSITPPTQLQFTFNLTSAQLSSINDEIYNNRWDNLCPIIVNGTYWDGGTIIGDFWIDNGNTLMYGEDTIVPTDGTPFTVDIPINVPYSIGEDVIESVYIEPYSTTMANNMQVTTGTAGQNKEYLGGTWVDRGNFITGAVSGVKGDSESTYRTGDVNITAANVGAATSSHTHGFLNNDGSITTSYAIGGSDRLVFSDYSNSGKIVRANVIFDGSTTTKALTQKGTFETFLQTAPVTSVNGNTGAVTISVPTKVSDLTNDSGFTANTGTITSVKMNGSTVSSSGEADLGTVITAHAKHKLTATNGTASSTSGTITYVESLTGTNTATDGDLTVTATRKTVTIPSAPGTLTTTSTTALSTATNEALSGSISLHKVAKTGTYSDLVGKPTIPTVNDSTISIQKGGTAVDSFTTNASSGKTINIPNELPSYSSSDSGKILSVNSSGALVWITPSYVYSGSSAPSNSTGNNGDIYLQTS